MDANVLTLMASRVSLAPADKAYRYAFDVVGQLFFSHMFGFMKDKHDYNGYIQSLDSLLPVLTTASVMPSYARPLFLLGGAMMPKISKALKSIKEMEQAADLCIAERQALLEKGGGMERNDILKTLFDIAQEQGERVDFGMLEVKVEVYVALYVQSPSSFAPFLLPPSLADC